MKIRREGQKLMTQKSPARAEEVVVGCSLTNVKEEMEEEEIKGSRVSNWLTMKSYSQDKITIAVESNTFSAEQISESSSPESHCPNAHGL